MGSERMGWSEPVLLTETGSWMVERRDALTWCRTFLRNDGTLVATAKLEGDDDVPALLSHAWKTVPVQVSAAKLLLAAASPDPRAAAAIRLAEAVVVLSDARRVAIKATGPDSIELWDRVGAATCEQADALAAYRSARALGTGETQGELEAEVAEELRPFREAAWRSLDNLDAAPAPSSAPGAAPAAGEGENDG